MLSDRCLSSLSCAVCDVGVLWPNGWMDQSATWCEDRPRPRRHCLRWGPSSRHGKGHIRPHFWAHVYCGQMVAHLSNCSALVKIFGNLFLRIITLLLRWLFCIYIRWSCCRILTMLLCIATNICKRLERDKGPRTLEVTVGRCTEVSITVLTEHLLTEVPSSGWVHPSINGTSVNFRNWQSVNPWIHYTWERAYKWRNFRGDMFRLFTARSWQVAAGTFSVILQLPCGQCGRNSAIVSSQQQELPITEVLFIRVHSCLSTEFVTFENFRVYFSLSDIFVSFQILVAT